MRLERFKIENLIPSSVFGAGLPVYVGGNNTIQVDGNYSGIQQNADILVSDNVQGLGIKTNGGFSIRELNKISALGYRFIMPVGFKIDGKLYQLPWEPVMSISSKKTIVETPLSGNTRRGTVKEIINAEDYEISLSGICYDHTHTGYPIDQVELLKTLDDYLGSMEIISGLTDLFDIKKVVVKSLSLPAMQGKPYAQNYGMELVSDEDFILIKQ